MNVQYLGHSCFLLEAQGRKIIIDPFLSENPGASAKPEDIEVEAILISHGHADHVGDAVQIAKKNDCIIIACYELAMYLAKKDVKVHPLGIGGSYKFDWGKVKLVQAQHGIGIEGEEENIEGSVPTGFVIEMDDKTIYHAGDTGLFGDMKIIGETNNIDLALLPIGDNFTMGIDDSIIAAKWLNAKKSIPMHYNTFELIKQDPYEWLEKMKANNLFGEVLEAGNSITL